MKKLMAVLAFVLIFAVSGLAEAEKLSEAEKSMEIAKRTEIRLLIEDLANYREAQVAAVNKLIELGNDAVPMLLRYLKNSKIENIRANICLVLGKIGAIDAIDAICNALADKSIYVQIMAQEGLRSLAHANSDAAIGDVTEALQKNLSTPNDFVRSLVVEILIDLNPADLWEVILGLLQNSFWKVRADAAKALGGISSQMDRSQQARICNALIPLFNDKDWKVRRSVALSTGFYLALSTMYVVPLDSEDETFKGFKASPNISVVKAIANNLVGLLADKSADVRVCAAYSLGKLWTVKVPDVSATVLGALAKALDDASDEVRIAVAASLGNIGDKKCVEALIGHLDEKVPLVLNIIVEALRKRTLKNFGFQPYELVDESPEEPIDSIRKYEEALEQLYEKRAEAIEKWKQWWEENSDSFEINEIIR